MTGIDKQARFYAHALRKGYNPSVRIDKTETQFYASAARVKNGVYKGSFYLSDLITEFRITANAFDRKGRIGYAQKTFQTQLPFFIDFKLPPSLTLGDSIQVPVFMTNLLKKSATIGIQVQASDSLSYAYNKMLVTVQP